MRLTAWCRRVGCMGRKFESSCPTMRCKDLGHSSEWPFSFLRPVTPAARRQSPDRHRVPFPVSSRLSPDFRPLSRSQPGNTILAYDLLARARVMFFLHSSTMRCP